MAASSFAGPNLFEDSVLDKVLAESREDSAVSANLALVEAVSFPVFGAAKSGQKASSDQSSAAASSSSASCGRGRGSSGTKPGSILLLLVPPPSGIVRGRLLLLVVDLSLLAVVLRNLLVGRVFANRSHSLTQQ